jgi:hypothetical protein
MDDLGWKFFEGTPHEIGRQLSRYWAQRLRSLKSKSPGRTFYNQAKKRFDEQFWGECHQALASAFQLRFPLLWQEIEGMVEGAKEAGFRTASFRSMFRLCLGELDEGLESGTHAAAIRYCWGALEAVAACELTGVRYLAGVTADARTLAYSPVVCAD